MRVELQTALDSVDDAAFKIFGVDSGIRSLGVGRNGDGYGYIAIRNQRATSPQALRIGARSPPDSIDGISIHYQNSVADPVSLARVPHSGPASPGIGSLILEQQGHQPLACGLQLQNHDDDLRTQEITSGYMTIGTLGCFVELPNHDIAILSNNHVLAGENRGFKGQDRILQPGGVQFDPAMQVATLTEFEPLVVSPPAASISTGGVTYNLIDAAVATLSRTHNHVQAYLPSRLTTQPRGTANARIGDKVHKVGRTTGLTFGEVKQVGVVVGPVAYGIGGCWFRQSVVIEGSNGTTFSDHGDSGSAIVRDSDGIVVGLLYAGNGSQTYACSIATIMNSLNLRLA
jgi:hypothetical protein